VAYICSGTISVAFLAPAQTFRAFAREIVAKVGKIVAAAYVLAVLAHGHGCQTGALRPVLHQLFKLLHIAEISYIQFSL